MRLFFDAPNNKQFYFQDSVTLNFERIIDLHNKIFVCMTFTFLFVCWMLIRSAFLFRESNAQNLRFSFQHNTTIEQIYTLIPIFILIIIALPACSLLYLSDQIATPEGLLIISGDKWYWHLTYNNFGKDAILYHPLLTTSDFLAELKSFRVISVDNQIVWPFKNMSYRIIVLPEEMNKVNTSNVRFEIDRFISLIQKLSHCLQYKILPCLLLLNFALFVTGFCTCFTVPEEVAIEIIQLLAIDIVVLPLLSLYVFASACWKFKENGSMYQEWVFNWLINKFLDHLTTHGFPHAREWYEKYKEKDSADVVPLENFTTEEGLSYFIPDAGAFNLHDISSIENYLALILPPQEVFLFSQFFSAIFLLVLIKASFGIVCFLRYHKSKIKRFSLPKSTKIANFIKEFFFISKLFIVFLILFCSYILNCY